MLHLVDSCLGAGKQAARAPSAVEIQLMGLSLALA